MLSSLPLHHCVEPEGPFEHEPIAKSDNHEETPFVFIRFELSGGHPFEGRAMPPPSRYVHERRKAGSTRAFMETTLVVGYESSPLGPQCEHPDLKK